MIRYIVIFLSVIILFSCRSNQMTREEKLPVVNREVIFAPGPQAVIYKTVKDYADLIPVIMDDSKTKIISYPSPTDIYYNGKLAKPTVLKNGYLLDNRGINGNVAFLSYTYEEYSKLTGVPTMSEMLGKIVNRQPLVEMIDCGLRTQYKEEVKELNMLINAGFPGCKRATIITPPVLTD